MKKLNMVLLATILISASCFAQKGNNAIGLGADLAFPTANFSNHFKTGAGLYAKALFGVGKAGQLTVTGGYTSFKEIGSGTDWSANFSMMPLLVGYRHNFDGFFVEPQFGFVHGGYKYKEGGDSFTDSEALISWVASAGYVFKNKIEVSARYQKFSNSSDDGVVFGLRLGYNFSLSGSK